MGPTGPTGPTALGALGRPGLSLQFADAETSSHADQSDFSQMNRRSHKVVFSFEFL